MKYLLVVFAMIPAVLFAQTSSEDEFETLLTAYYKCSAIAEDRLLSTDEHEACTGIYQDIKLSFIDGMAAVNKLKKN